jgi:glycosidase
MFQFAYPGAPAIYYGDEIGLVGGKDPGCRGAFLWEETSWNVELRNFLKTLINLRKNHIALRRGDYIGLEQNSNPDSYAFARTTAEDKVLIIMNASANESKVNINIKKIGWEDGRVVKDLITPEKQYTISNHSILVTLPGWGGLWLG